MNPAQRAHLEPATVRAIVGRRVCLIALFSRYSFGYGCTCWPASTTDRARPPRALHLVLHGWASCPDTLGRSLIDDVDSWRPCFGRARRPPAKDDPRALRDWETSWHGRHKRFLVPDPGHGNPAPAGRASWRVGDAPPAASLDEDVVDTIPLTAPGEAPAADLVVHCQVCPRSSARPWAWKRRITTCCWRSWASRATRCSVWPI